MKNSPTLLFGTHAIREAILGGANNISKIWLKSGVHHAGHEEVITLAKKHAIPYSKVPLAKLHRLTKGKHQGAIAFCAPIAFSSLPPIIAAAYEARKVPLVLLLDQVQDVGNIGAIARTALAAGVDALVVGTKNAAPIGGDAIKASAGALLSLPVCRVGDIAATLSLLKESGLQIIACTEKGAQSIYQTDFSGPTALLLGNEAKGIARACLAIADKQVFIPMQGPIASLNVSVAAAVMLYEIVRTHQKLN